MSNASTGQYYKLRTKKWLIGKGYQAEYLEQYHRIVTPRGVIMTKRDLFASDILAMNDKELVFVQVKFGRQGLAKAVKEFAKYQFPPFASRWIVVWERGAREPDIIEV